MLNCVVPRSVFELIGERYGEVFGSTAPDYSFAFRCLDVVDSTLYYDRSVLLDSGYEQSIGSNYQRGLSGAHKVDFLTSVGAGSPTRATPLPSLPAYPNAMVNEYMLAQKESRTGKFPPLVTGSYLAALAKGTTAVEDVELRRQAELALRQAGWRGRTRVWNSLLSAAHLLRYAIHPRDFVRRALWRRRRAFGGRGPTLGLILGRLRMAPPGEAGDSAEGAIAFVNRNPVERTRVPIGLRSLLAPDEPDAGRGGRG
jgi:hypothetical protein